MGEPSREELEQAQVKAAAAQIVVETQAEELAELRGELRITTRARDAFVSIAETLKAKFATQAEELDRLRKLAEVRVGPTLAKQQLAQAEELERLRAGLDQKNIHEAALNNTIGRLRAQLTKQAAVIEASRDLFECYPPDLKLRGDYFELTGPYQGHYERLRDALDALTTTETPYGPGNPDYERRMTDIGHENYPEEHPALTTEGDQEDAEDDELMRGLVDRTWAEGDQEP